MAREKQITRTISSTKAVALVADLSNNAITEHIYTVTGTYTAETVMARLKADYETDTLKMLTVKSIELSEKLYGMPESVFMQYAQELPPR